MPCTFRLDRGWIFLTAAVLTAGFCLPVSTHARPINGLVLKFDGSEIARAFNGSAFGEVSVPPGEVLGPITISLLDPAEVEFTPAGLDTTVNGSMADSQVATYADLGGYDFEVEGLLDEEMTELTITVYDNGTPIYTSPGIEVHVEEGHQEADGLIVRKNGIVLVHVWRGDVDCFLHVLPGGSTGTLELTFLDPDSVEFLPPPGGAFTFDHEIDNPGLVSLTPVGDWDFSLNGLSNGSTNLRLVIVHEDHADFTSPDLPILVAATSQVGEDPVSAGRPVIRLLPPAPNPFTQSTTIRFSSPVHGAVEIQIFDASGRLVRSLPTAAGSSSIAWDGHNNNGQPVPSGVYFVHSLALGRRGAIPVQLVR